MELGQADNYEPQGDVQSPENANTGAMYSKVQISVIIEVEKALDRLVLGLCCVFRECPEFGPEILEFITANF